MVRRWAHDPGPAWQHREVQVHRDEHGWFVRRVGQVHLPDERHDTEDDALESVMTLIGPDWVEVPADRSPKR